MEEVPNLNWYALKVFYNKVFEMEERLQARGLQTYLAVEKVPLKGADHLAARRKLADHSVPPDTRYIEEGPVIYLRRPLVSSLLFVLADEDRILQVEELLNEPLQWGGKARGFIYKTADFSAYATIPPGQMEAFRLVVDAGVGGLEFFADDDITRYKKGDKVRVKEGPLKGAEGYIKRIRRDRRLLVSIQGIIAVATSYIPPEQLEIVH